MRKIIRYAKQAALQQGPILLRGEEDVGKGQLAQAIHFASEQASGPLVCVNCQALPKERIALALMGSDEQGLERAGKFELAHGGTLVLEQVDSLPSPMQAALLQLLKTGRLQRFDSARNFPLKVRIIATTSAVLEARVQAGQFGRQLLYALQGCELWLPKLADRAADLAKLISQQLHEQADNGTRRFSKAALDCLLNYHWPGNLAQLRSTIEYALLHSQAPVIEAQDLPPEIYQRYLGQGVAELGYFASVEPAVMPAVKPFKVLERQAILQAAQLCHGQIGKMAVQLGISRTTLWRRIKQMEIQLTDYQR